MQAALYIIFIFEYFHQCNLHLIHLVNQLSMQATFQFQFWISSFISTPPMSSDQVTINAMTLHHTKLLFQLYSLSISCCLILMWSKRLECQNSNWLGKSMKRNTAPIIMIVNFGVNLSKKKWSRHEGGNPRVPATFPPPNLLSWILEETLSKSDKMSQSGAHDIVSVSRVYNLSKIYLWCCSTPWNFTSFLRPPDMWSMFIFWPQTPLFSYKDIISHSSYIYCWKKLNYCDFIVAPAPKWFLVISHHFSCSAELWFLETLNVFYFIPPAWNQTEQFLSYHQPKPAPVPNSHVICHT